MSAETIAQRGLAGKRGLIATVPAVGSIVLLGLLMVDGLMPEGLSSLAVYLCAGLWVLAAFILAPVDETGARQIGLLAAGVYGIAFLLPAATIGSSLGDPVMGYVAYVGGATVVPLAWLANPLFLFGLVAYRQRNFGAVIALALLAILMALTVYVTLDDVSPGIGFVVWVAAQGFLILGAAVHKPRSL